jgi:hypothetical protein
MSLDIHDKSKGDWRGTAMEHVLYTDDFPEAILTFPEILDGGMGHGRADAITITFKQLTPTTWKVTVRDNGRGIVSESRLLEWSAPASVSTHHRNGRGHKTAMAKFAPDYDTADWRIQFRRRGGFLTTLTGPFLGFKTKRDENEDDETTLMPSGTETEIVFDAKVLGKYTTAPLLHAALREVITSRYSEALLRRIAFTVTVHTLDELPVTVNSHAEGDVWHSFRTYVEQGVAAGYIKAIRENEQYESHGAPWTLSVYKITVKGNKSFPLKKHFPTYGQKNIRSQRVHIALGDRVIEMAPYYPFIGRASGHNDDNGTIVFVTFTSDDLARQPQPCTTKVSMYANDEIYKVFHAHLSEILKTPPEADTDSDDTVDAVSTRTDYKRLISESLGVTFHMKNGVMLIKFPDGDDMYPLRGFELTPTDIA